MQDPVTEEVHEEFTLYPNAQINPSMGLISNPDTRHYATKDIYTHVTSVPDNTEDRKFKDLQFFTLSLGDTLSYNGYKVVLKQINNDPQITNLNLSEYEIRVGASLSILYEAWDDWIEYKTEPLYLIKDLASYNVETFVEAIGLKFSFNRILPEKNEIEIGIAEEKADYIVMKAIVFPFINVLWLGAITMVIGIFISMNRRYQDNKRINSNPLGD
ncbi:MAG: hypothetical protein JKX95_02055 [Bacteroidia bacterium]|nr:hypothetical protein [Bacteroidia bacterium]